MFAVTHSTLTGKFVGALSIPPFSNRALWCARHEQIACRRRFQICNLVSFPPLVFRCIAGNLTCTLQFLALSGAVAQCSGGLSRGVDERIRRGGALLQPPTCVLGDSIDIEQWFGIGRCSLRLCKLGLESMRVYARTRFFEDKLDQPFATELRGPSFW